MKRRSSRLVWLPSMLVAMMVLASCGGTPATTTPDATAPTTAAGATAAPAAAAPTTASAPADAGGAITIAHWQHQFEAREKIVKDLVAEYQTANPNVKIDFQSIAYNDYFQKIGPSLEAGTGPDVFQIPGPLVREFYERGQLAAMPPDVFAAGEIEQEFIGWPLELLKQEGQYVGLPTDVQPFLLFYNDDLFKEAGLDPTKDFASLEELTAAAVKLTKREGDTLTQIGADITSSPYQWYWAMLMNGFEEGVVDEQTLKVTYNNEQGVRLWTWLTDLVKKEKVDSAEFLTGQDRFSLGKAGMGMHEYTYVGNLEAGAPDLNYSLHLMPSPEGMPAATAGTHWAYVVSKQSKNPEAAWAWIKYITSEEAQRKWIAGGGEMPSRKALYDDASLTSDPNTAAGLKAMEVTKPFDDFGWDDVYTIHQAIWDNVVLKDQDVAAAVQEAAAAEEKLYQDKRLTPAK